MKIHPLLRRILFLLDPERAHQLTLRLVSLAGVLPPVQFLLRQTFSYSSPGLAINLFGLKFPNPLGLAAGYDKDGLGMHGLACLGFGHIELGTVTPLPQRGNPQPRIFRLLEDEALINRMGFPNVGADALLRRLQLRRPKGVILGINIGKGSDTPLDEAAQDYRTLMHAFYPHGDYLVVNVSSPNTIGLRRLQAREHLEGLLQVLIVDRARLHSSTGRFVPLLIKLAPDLSDEELEDAIQVISDSGLDGVIATNTTIARNGLHSPLPSEIGGLSGLPLRRQTKEVVSQIYRLTDGKLPIVGVGGIFGSEDARALLEAGASLIQLYTGLVYRGPGVVKEILVQLAKEGI
ncbi:MAG: dihydroorotate dehydrogenase (quinone) [Chloroflexi bacterium RBG_16_48_8]|nr:MAG: dihydroorotate dehydrogenase (quinone) [Chloroflexi bacterium RBG_16_48_8]